MAGQVAGRVVANPHLKEYHQFECGDVPQHDRHGVPSRIVQHPCQPVAGCREAACGGDEHVASCAHQHDEEHRVAEKSPAKVDAAACGCRRQDDQAERCDAPVQREPRAEDAEEFSEVDYPRDGECPDGDPLARNARRMAGEQHGDRKQEQDGAPAQPFRHGRRRGEFAGCQRDAEKEHQPEEQPLQKPEGRLHLLVVQEQEYPAQRPEQLRGVVGQDGLPGGEVIGDQVPLEKSVVQQHEERAQDDVGQVEASELAAYETPRGGGLSVVEEIARDEKEDGRVEIVGEGFQRCQDRGV